MSSLIESFSNRYGCFAYTRQYLQTSTDSLKQNGKDMLWDCVKMHDR